MTEFNPGDQIMVDSGQYRGALGTFVRYDLVYSGQTRMYPVVKLERGPTVRVVSLIYRPGWRPPDPNDCALCGTPERRHGQHYYGLHEISNQKGYVAPTNQVRLDRMKKRREQRNAAQ